MKKIKKYHDRTTLICDVPDCVKKAVYLVKGGMPIPYEKFEFHNICQEHFDFYKKKGKEK